MWLWSDLGAGSIGVGVVEVFCSVRLLAGTGGAGFGHWVAGRGTADGVDGPGAISRSARRATGKYCRKNILLRRLSNCLASTTTPVLSHLVGCGPL